MISLPLDGSFLRRECRCCRREFKWFHGSHPSKPGSAEDPEYWSCPYCNHKARGDDWATSEQRQLLAVVARNLTIEAIEDAARSLCDVQFTAGGFEITPYFTARSDMTAVQPPCHPWEPVKVIDSWNDPLHCVVCGGTYTL